jgi:hypothetical protein
MVNGPSDDALLRCHSRGVLLVIAMLLAIGGDRLLPLNFVGGNPAEAALTVEMVTDPQWEKAFADTQPVQLIFTASVAGKPLHSGRLTVDVTAPQGPLLLPNPFPAVEGTTLLQLASELRDGSFAVEYLFPMHGVYTFDFDIAPGPDEQVVQPAKVRESLHVQTDPATVRRAWLFRAALFSLGGIVGVWYALTVHNPKTPLPRAVIAPSVLVLVGFVLASSPFTYADHGPRELIFPKGVQVVQGNEGWALEIRPSPEQGVVGELLTLTVTLTRDGKVFSGAMDVAMHVYNLKDDQTVLRANVLAPDGSTSQRFQLVESAPHTCTVTVRPAGGESGSAVTLTAVVGIDVGAASTPITVKLRVMGLFIGVIGAGMAAGFVVASSARKAPGRVER